MLEMMSHALINVGKHIMSNVACAHCQRNTYDSVIYFAQKTLCEMTDQTLFQIVNSFSEKIS